MFANRGKTLRVTTQLIDGASGDYLWSNQLTEKMQTSLPFRRKLRSQF